MRESMRYEELKETVQSKPFFILFSVLVLWFYLGFWFGKRAGFIPAHIQCKETIYQVEMCTHQYNQLQQVHAQELIDAKAHCLKNKCQTLCTEQVQQAIDSYKALDIEFKCGSDL